MKEIKDIIRAYDEAARQGKGCALATVVHVNGSSYRRPGARMLVAEDGVITGAISGGCLEGDALRKAQAAIFEQQAQLVVYDSSDPDDLEFGVQLGCNGVVSILFEPVGETGNPNPISLLKRAVRQRRDGLLVTVFNSEGGGTCGYVSADEEIWLCEDATLRREASGWPGGHTIVKEYPEYSVLFQAVAPPVQLVVAGAGNDAQPLVALASVLGWETVVADGRATHAKPRRFPEANKVLVTRPQNLPGQIEVDARTAFVLMTHNYNYDLALLECLSAAGVSYIGLLGPGAKRDRMLGELAAKGFTVPKDLLHRLHGPAGLDIGAEAAEEIALSILAEIKAVFAGRPGTPLKFRAGPIYERS